MVYRTANVSSQTCSYDKWKPTGILIDVINVDDTKITPRGTTTRELDDANEVAR